jgi:uncharacterized protein with von Willebrand factor type A (vWA) domain
MGDQVFDRFSANKDQTLWYYRAVVAALSDGWDHALLNELDAMVDRMHDLAGVRRENL